MAFSLRWPGSKRTEAKRIAPFLPAESEYDTHVEPFAGSAALWFFGPQKPDGVCAVFNDTHADLMNFYRALQDPGLVMDMYTGLLLLGENTAPNYIHMRDNHAPVSDLDAAVRFAFLRRTCFRGCVSNYKTQYKVSYGGVDVRRGSSELVPKRMMYEGLLDMHEQMRGVAETACGPFDGVVERYLGDARAFIFLDPPYTTAYDYNFTEADHRRLAEMTQRHGVRAKIMVVVNDTPLMRECYSHMHETAVYDKKFKASIVKERPPATRHLVLTNYAMCD